MAHGYEPLAKTGGGGSHSKKWDPKLVHAFTAGGMYMAVSVGMNFINKDTIRAYNMPNTLLMLQMMASIAVIVPLRKLGFITQFSLWSTDKARRLLPVVLLYTANVGFALVALKTLSIPMYNAIKRLTPVAVLVTKSVLTRTVPAWQISASVLLVVSGCIVAAMGDLMFSMVGYVFALISCMLQALYLLLVERTGAENGVPASELLYYNAVLSMPFIAVVMAGTGEMHTVWPEFLVSMERTSPTYMCSMVMLCSFLGIALNYSLFVCTQLTSALTTTVLGVMKGVVSTVLGFFIGGGTPFHPVNVAGIALNTTGGIWYSVVKYNQRRAAPAKLQRVPSITPLSALDEEGVGVGGGSSGLTPSSSSTMLAMGLGLSNGAPMLPARPPGLPKSPSPAGQKGAPGAQALTRVGSAAQLLQASGLAANSGSHKSS